MPSSRSTNAHQSLYSSWAGLSLSAQSSCQPSTHNSWLRKQAKEWTSGHLVNCAEKEHVCESDYFKIIYSKQNWFYISANKIQNQGQNDRFQTVYLLLCSLQIILEVRLKRFYMFHVQCTHSFNLALYFSECVVFLLSLIYFCCLFPFIHYFFGDFRLRWWLWLFLRWNLTLDLCNFNFRFIFLQLW